MLIDQTVLLEKILDSNHIEDKHSDTIRIDLSETEHVHIDVNNFLDNFNPVWSNNDNPDDVLYEYSINLLDVIAINGVEYIIDWDNPMF